MSRKRIFNNEKVTLLLVKYRRNKKDIKLRDRIVRLTMPLVDAAMSRKHMYRNRDDIRQECALKVLLALPKFDKNRGSAFAFLWSVICNTCITQNQRLSSSDLSLSTDETAKREAEANTHNVFEMPENRHILNRLGLSLEKAFNVNGFRVPNRRLHRKACVNIRTFIASGEFFYDRNVVMRRLRRLGLAKEDIQFYIDYTLVIVREKLLEARENSRAIAVRQVGKDVSEKSDY